MKTLNSYDSREDLEDFDIDTDEEENDDFLNDDEEEEEEDEE